MTCIAGLVHEGQVYLGADSAGISGYDLTVRSDTKLFQNGPFVGGFTSSFRMGQLLAHAWKPPKASDDNTMRYLVGPVVNSLRKLFKAGGYKGESGEDGGEFLLGYQGGLYVISNDFQVGVSADPYAAVGCGGPVACGSLYATARLDLGPQERVRLALEAAEHHSAGVRGPFIYQTLETTHDPL